MIATTQRLQPVKYLHVEDEATIVVTYPGAVGIIQASWNWPYARKDMEIYGQRGSVLVPRPDLVRLRGATTAEQELKAPTLQPARPEALTVYRRFPVAKAPEEVDMLGTEKRLANWITDAMRTTTQADIALYNPVYYRGLPIPQGTVDIVDIIPCSRPFDEELVTLRPTGREILALLESNLPNPNGRREPALAVNREGAGPIVQVSALRYKYDLKQPVGSAWSKAPSIPPALTPSSWKARSPPATRSNSENSSRAAPTPRRRSGLPRRSMATRRVEA